MRVRKKIRKKILTSFRIKHLRQGNFALATFLDPLIGCAISVSEDISEIPANTCTLVFFMQW